MVESTEERPEGEARPIPKCPACGAEARRMDARFCSTCGRSLSEQYNPADALRASYHLHRPKGVEKPSARPTPVSKRRPMATVIPEPNRNPASTTALALTTYSLVPFLGILFVPGALFVGVVGFAYSYYAPQRGGRRASLASVLFGVVIMGVQIFLWWIIVKVPEWSNPETGGL